MSYLCQLFLLTILFMAVTEDARAASLNQDFQALQDKRSDLETQREEHETTIALLERRRREAEIQFQRCANDKFRVLLQESSRITEAESRRRELEQENSELRERNKLLRQVNRDLETRRRSIEREFRGTARGDRYEEKFRGWINDNYKEYVDPVELVLFPAYGKYEEGIGLYIEVIDMTVKYCDDFGVLAFESLPPLLDKAINEIGDLLKQ